MPDLDAISDAAYAAAGADFAFVLTLSGRLMTRHAPRDMRWYLVYREFRTGQRDFVAFRRWIIRAAAEPAARRKGPRHAN